MVNLITTTLVIERGKCVFLKKPTNLKLRFVILNNRFTDQNIAWMCQNNQWKHLFVNPLYVICPFREHGFLYLLKFHNIESAKSKSMNFLALINFALTPESFNGCVVMSNNKKFCFSVVKTPFSTRFLASL